MSISSSSPGKLMLFGEHAVVYGGPCIVTAVNKRLMVSMSETTDGKVMIDAPKVNNTKFVESAIVHGCRAWGITHHGLAVKTESSFSDTFGFGSSSAVTVSALMSLAALYKKAPTKKELFDVAYETVLDVQKVGSGFDVAAAVFGSTIKYQNKGEVIEPLHIDTSTVELVVGYSGVKADTVAIVKQIAEKKEKYGEAVNKIFEAIGALVVEAEKAMKEGDWVRVGTLMNFNQEYLRDLGVSTEKLESMISGAKKAGAYGAKLSGAGGGDCIIALVSKDKRKVVEEAITAAGGEVMDATWNSEGARIELT